MFSVIAALLVLAGADCQNGIGFRLPDPDVRVIAFGSSTTAGPASMQYVDYLPDLLNESTSAFANEGMGGETTTLGKDRLQGLLGAGYFPNANTLIYWQGGNDVIDFIQMHDPLIAISPDSDLYLFSAELQALLDAIESNLRNVVNSIPEQIIDCTATPLDVIFPGQASVANDYIEKLNEVIRTVAMAESATLIDIADLDATLREDLANYHNCNHLSAAGNAIAAGRIAASIQGQ